MIASILTGVPVQTRRGMMLTGAGAQEQYWCDMLLKEMGDKGSIEKEILGMKTIFTKKQVLEHIKNI